MVVPVIDWNIPDSRGMLEKSVAAMVLSSGPLTSVS